MWIGFLLGSYGKSLVVIGFILLLSERFLLPRYFLVDASVSDPAMLRASLDERLFGFFMVHVVAALLSACATIVIWHWQEAGVLAKGFLLGSAANVAILVSWRLGILKSCSGAARVFGVVSLVFTCAFAISSGHPFDAIWRWSAGPLFAVFVALTVAPSDGWIYAIILTLTSLFPGMRPALFSTTQLEQEAIYVPMVLLFLILVLVSWKMRDAAVVYQVLERTFADEAKVKDMFISTVSHEIRTPLHGIIASVGMMRDEPSKQGRDELLENVSHCASVLSILVDNVLAMGSPEMAAQQGSVRVVMSEFVEKLRSIAKSLTVSNPAKVRVSYDDGMPRIVRFADAAVMQILINLCGNAIKHTRKEGGLVDVHFVMNADGRMRCSVSDNGSGVPRELQPKLFQPYVQGTQSGTGLGLYISKRLAEAMGGTVGYVPKEDGGSIFFLELPVSVEVIKGIERQGTPEQTLQATKTVAARSSILSVMNDHPRAYVIVEDNVMNQKVLLGYLRRLNIEPAAVLSDGASALQWLLDSLKAEKQQQVTVLLDVNMPVMGGIIAAKLWRSIEAEYPHCLKARIFLVTASHLTSLPPNVNGVLTKPMTLDRLRVVM